MPAVQNEVEMKLSQSSFGLLFFTTTHTRARPCFDLGKVWKRPQSLRHSANEWVEAWEWTDGLEPLVDVQINHKPSPS